MNKLRVICGTLAAALSIFTLSACADKTELPVRSDAVSSADEYVKENLTKEEITLVVWESDHGPDEWIKQAGKQFNEIYPNITIKYENIEIEKVMEVLTAPDGGLSTPDLFGAPHDKMGQLVEGGFVAPVDDENYITASTLYTASSGLKYNGKLYGYPTSCDTYALFYNKSLVKESNIPQTWHDLISWGESFSAVYPGKYSFVMRSDSMYYAAMFTTKNQNRLFDEDDNVTLNSQEVIGGMELWQRLLSLMPEDISEYAYQDCENLFLEGNAAMYVSCSCFIPKANESGIDYGVTTLLSMQGEDTPSISFSGVRGMFVNSAGTHQTEAHAFARFLLTEEMQQLRMDITGALPSIDIAVSDEHTLGFIDQLEYSYPVPSFYEMKYFWSYGAEFCGRILNGADARTELEAYQEYMDKYIKPEAGAQTDSGTESE